MVIKPSGVAYDRLTPSAMVATDLDGRAVEGGYAPSSDVPKHAALCTRRSSAQAASASAWPIKKR
jgi:ribulose-5-phosphate 4-epimerase/fuculose-1-phosphate aldolase